MVVSPDSAAAVNPVPSPIKISVVATAFADTTPELLASLTKTVFAAASAIFASVTFASKISEVVTALAAISLAVTASVAISADVIASAVISAVLIFVLAICYSLFTIY